jgi:hypothetical protein
VIVFTQFEVTYSMFGSQGRSSPVAASSAAALIRETPFIPVKIPPTYTDEPPVATV